MPDELPFADLVSVSSPLLPTGEPVLRHAAVMNAALEDVWQAFTTEAGRRSFAAPAIFLDFRIGGRWESSYDPRAERGDPANIVNEITSYLPMEMLSFRIARTPPGFPDPALGTRLWTVVKFQAAGPARTRVETAMLGWAAGDEQSPVFELFRRGNALTLGWLHDRFESGPKHWA